MIPLRIMIASPHCDGFVRRVLQLHQASDWLRTHGAAGCCSAEFFARWIKEKKTARVRDGEKRWKFYLPKNVLSFF